MFNCVVDHGINTENSQSAMAQCSMNFLQEHMQLISYGQHVRINQSDATSDTQLADEILMSHYNNCPVEMMMGHLDLGKSCF